MEEAKHTFRVLYIKKSGTSPVVTHVAACSKEDVKTELEKRGPVARILEIERIS